MMSHLSCEKQPLNTLAFFFKWYFNSLVFKQQDKGKKKRKNWNKLPADIVFLSSFPWYYLYIMKKQTNKIKSNKQKNIAAEFKGSWRLKQNSKDVQCKLQKHLK